jgi:hypothetical protein
VIVLRKIRTPHKGDERLPPVEIARITEQEVDQNAGAGVAGVCLLIFTGIALFKYFAAENVYQQMVALLLWIGNGVFWGVFLLARMVAAGRISIVYRDANPAIVERKEPQI